jgi:hypothetical protein
MLDTGEVEHSVTNALMVASATSKIVVRRVRDARMTYLRYRIQGDSG